MAPMIQKAAAHNRSRDLRGARPIIQGTTSMHDTRRSIGPTGGRSITTKPGWSSVIGDGNDVRACDPKLCENTLGQRSAYGDVIHPAATANIAATERREPSLRCTQSAMAGAIVMG